LASRWQWFSALVPVSLLAIVWKDRRKSPFPLTAMLLFILATATTLGLTTFLFQYYSTVADHYLYVAMLGPALALAWAVSKYSSPAVLITTAMLLALLG